MVVFRGDRLAQEWTNGRLPARDATRSGSSRLVGTASLILAVLPFVQGTSTARAQTSRPAADVGATASAPVTAPARPCGALDDAITSATTAVEECEACVAAARCVLVTRCGPLLSRRCLAAREDDGALVEVTGEGLALLDRAAEALGRTGDDADETVTSEMKDRIGLLRAFGRLFAAMGRDATTGASKKTILSACGGLSVYLDDENPGVVASAKLWMAAGYRMAGRPERTLQVIRLNLATPANARIDLLSRLERYRALGDQGEYAAALALCLRIEHRLESWFDDEATRQLAAESVRFARVELHRAWAAKLRKTAMADRAKQAEADAAKLIGSDSYPPRPEDLLGTDKAIHGLPDWVPLRTMPTTQTAKETPAN